MIPCFILVSERPCWKLSPRQKKHAKLLTHFVASLLKLLRLTRSYSVWNLRAVVGFVTYRCLHLWLTRDYFTTCFSWTVYTSVSLDLCAGPTSAKYVTVYLYPNHGPGRKRYKMAVWFYLDSQVASEEDISLWFAKVNVDVHPPKAYKFRSLTMVRDPEHRSRDVVWYRYEQWVESLSPERVYLFCLTKSQPTGTSHSYPKNPFAKFVVRYATDTSRH